MTPGELAERLGGADATVSVMVKRMLREDRPLIERIASPTDRRSVLVALSHEGWALLQRTAPGTSRAATRLIGCPLPIPTLVRLFGFWRDIGLRGLDFNAISGSVGWFLLYRVFLAILLTIRFRMDELKRRSEVRAYWRALGETGRGSQLSIDRG